MSSSSTDVTVDVTMPQMGVSVSEGTIVAWRKQVGDWVAYEETICEIATDKIDTDCPSPAAGRVVELCVEEGATVEVGVVLARIATDAKPGEPHVSESTPERPPAPRYSPVVSRMAAEHGLDLSSISGTGRGGRVTKKDVLAVLADTPTEEPPLHIESPYRPEPVAPVAEGGTLSRMRQQIGAHMKRSLDTAATCTTWFEVDFSGVERRRAQLGTTALPVVAEAVVQALRAFPALNATLDGERYTQHDTVGLGIAVSLGEDGLIVPVVRDAQDLSAEGLAKRIKDVARRARAKELVPDDLAGGTFTITNPGQYGAIMATPVIHQPQVAILDLEAVVKRPVVVTDAAGNDLIAIRPMCVLGMSWDHRALDGALAAQFLADIKRRLEAL